jgi:chromosome partitioning protein
MQIRDLSEIGIDRPQDPALPALDRTFPIWEICRYLIPIAPEHLRRSLRQNPDLPQGIGEGKARQFTAADIMTLRRFFAKTGRERKTKEGRKPYLPFRPETAPAQTIAIAGSSAQAGQTTTALHLATRAALEGYRVLAIDLTPSGALTAALPGGEGPPEGTLHSLMARHFAQHLQSENRARLTRGADPLPVDEALAAPLAQDTSALIRPTDWHRLDLLPGGAALWDMGLSVAGWQRQAPDWQPWQALQARLAEDGVLARYDLIVIDTPPLLEALSLGALHLADHVIVPMRLGHVEGTLARLRQIASAFAQIETQINTAARALGGMPVTLGQAQCQLLITRHDARADLRRVDVLRAELGEIVLPPALPQEPALRTTGGLLAMDPREMPREAYVTARAPLEALWAEISTQIAAGWQQT